MGKVLLRANVDLKEWNEHGQLEQYCAGDWFETSKVRARELIELGKATIPGTKEARAAVVGDLSSYGIVVVNGTKDDAVPLTSVHPEVSVVAGDALVLPFEKTLIWTPNVPMRPERMAIGFGRVDSPWEMAAMLSSPLRLMKTFGTEEDQKGTEDYLGDLRLPVYECGASWIRKTSGTEGLVEEWEFWRRRGVGLYHAFTRALYKNPVRFCTLPERWLAHWIPV